MDEIDIALNKFANSTEFEKMKAKESNSNSNFGNIKQVVKNCEIEIKEILINEINKIKSNAVHQRFINAIIINSYFKTGVGWQIDIDFNEDSVVSNSLWYTNPKYEKGAYLPSIFNNGYSTRNYVYGYNNNGEYIKSLRKRDGSLFITNTVKIFNNKHKNENIVATCNEIYKGGKMERDGLASFYFSK